MIYWRSVMKCCLCLIRHRLLLCYKNRSLSKNSSHTTPAILLFTQSYIGGGGMCVCVWGGGGGGGCMKGRGVASRVLMEDRLSAFFTSLWLIRGSCSPLWHRYTGDDVGLCSPLNTDEAVDVLASNVFYHPMKCGNFFQAIFSQSENH